MDKYFKKCTPLYERDEHNENFYVWHRARYEGYLNGPVDLFHIDAHSDMGQPTEFKNPLYFKTQSKDGYLKYYQDFANSQLNINDFILPAVLTGVVKNIYFIYPKWRKLKPTRKKMNICSVFGEGKILKYGVKSERNPHRRTILKTLPDLKFFNYYAYGIDRIPKDRKVILDIDLDYFACRDSILNNIRHKLEITKEQFLDKERFLNTKTLKFTGLDFGFKQANGKYYATISHKKVKDASHLPPKKEVKSEIDNLLAILERKKINPVIITICKSRVSGYCPAYYYEFIAKYLKQRLVDIFNAKVAQ